MAEQISQFEMEHKMKKKLMVVFFMSIIKNHMEK